MAVAWVAVEIHRATGESPQQGIVRAVIGYISGFLLGILVYSVAFWVQRGFKFDSAAS
jgi:hypothetical protein